MNQLKLDDPRDFFRAVPTEPLANLEFRKTLHRLLLSDKGFQRAYKEMLLEYPPLFYNTIAWTFNPQKPAGHRNQPFILRPAQIKAVEGFDYCYKNGKEVVLDKTRKEGASELITKFLAMQWLLSPEFQALMGSRKENLVDDKTQWSGGKISGNPSCLFHKVLYTLYFCPEWLKPKPNSFSKTNLLLQNLDNGAVIAGESTNDNFGAGSRHSIVFIDVSDCVIYCSTHFYGVAHPYNQLLTGQFGQKEILTLAWEDNPEENVGLYRSPEPGVVAVRDIAYYRAKCPEVFNDIEADEPIKVEPIQDKLEKAGIAFVADGGDSNEGGWRSVWYDKIAAARSPRDIAQNIDRRPIGAGETFFSLATLRRMEMEHCRPADILCSTRTRMARSSRPASWSRGREDFSGGAHSQMDVPDRTETTSSRPIFRGAPGAVIRPSASMIVLRMSGSERMQPPTCRRRALLT